MFPNATSTNAPNSRWRDSILAREVHAIAVLLRRVADNSYLTFRQHGVARLFTLATISLNHISHVVGLRAIRQMSRIDTRWVITRMQNKIWGGMAIVQLIRKTVSPNILAVNGEYAVTSYVSPTNPKPTGIRFGNVLPKTLLPSQRPLRRIAMNKPSLVMRIAKTTAKMFFGTPIKLASSYHGAIIT